MASPDFSLWLEAVTEPLSGGIRVAPHGDRNRPRRATLGQWRRRLPHRPPSSTVRRCRRATSVSHPDGEHGRRRAPRGGGQPQPEDRGHRGGDVEPLEHAGGVDPVIDGRRRATPRAVVGRRDYGRGAQIGGGGGRELRDSGGCRSTSLGGLEHEVPASVARPARAARDRRTSPARAPGHAGAAASTSRAGSWRLAPASGRKREPTAVGRRPGARPGRIAPRKSTSSSPRRGARRWAARGARPARTVVPEDDHVRGLEPSGGGRARRAACPRARPRARAPSAPRGSGAELVLEGVGHQEVREQQVRRPPAHDVAGQLQRQPVLQRRQRPAHAPVGVALDRQPERPGFGPQRTRGPLLEQRLIQKLRDVVADAAHRRASWASRGRRCCRPAAVAASHSVSTRGWAPRSDLPRGGPRGPWRDRAPRCRGSRGRRVVRRSPAWCDRATSRWGTPGAAPPRRRRAPPASGAMASAPHVSRSEVASSPSTLIRTTVPITSHGFASSSVSRSWRAAGVLQSRGPNPRAQELPLSVDEVHRRRREHAVAAYRPRRRCDR